MTSKTKPLNDEMKKVFYPWVRAKGFVKQKSTDPHFVEFRRETSSGIDVFEVQWDKYWRPYFVINFKKERVSDPKWQYPGRLQRISGGSLNCWFSLSKPFIYKLLTFHWSYEPTEVVEELMYAFEELENWWKNGEVGGHMYFNEVHG
ncbi:hypothetical protein CW740_00215 [Kangiella profundi]|uniref:Uncharacterized protein n=1 Tax=Kangiella profundi TaxID=1561924 RepID=A0A2K9ARF9_9GAMM|nr:hypothetical protein [Kangiella profundi]AUD77741.1 hypothetical protein CW740_00215 [Kangiella profundi]GGE93013.1 hypothetical protein GCM10011356_03840 [Kangiella profundi]